jgi:hypothetical protein
MACLCAWLLYAVVRVRSHLEVYHGIQDVRKNTSDNYNDVYGIDIGRDAVAYTLSNASGMHS